MNKTFVIKILVFILLSFIFTSFLTLNDGYWGYLDAGYEFEPNQNYGKLFYLLFSTLSVDTFFGYDSGILGGARFFGGLFEVGLKYLFGYNLGLTLFIVLFFLGSFFSSYFILKEFYNKNLSYIGGLFFTFNPISLYFISQPGFILSYFSGLLFILAIVTIIKYHKIFLGLLLLISSIFLLFSYPRILGIYFLLFILLFVLNVKNIFNFIIKNKTNTLILFLTIVITLLPLGIKLFYSYNIEQSYFSGVGNYADIHLSFGYSLYEGIKNNSFYNGIYLSEITSNYQHLLQSNIYYKLFLLIFILYFTFFTLLRKDIKKSKYFYLMLGLLILIILLKQLSKFTNPDIFVKIYYNYYPFIANNSNWLNVLIVVIIAFLIPYVFLNTKNNRIIILNYSILTLFFLFLTIPFFHNYKLSLIKDIPNNYYKTFYNNIYGIPESSFFLPGLGLYMNWSNYPINQIGGLNMYKGLFTNNSRLVNQKQADLNNIVNNLKEKNNIENSSLFNLKNIFVFKDIRNASEGQFDFFQVKDYVGESKMYYEKFKNHKNLYTKQDNENFSQFGLKDDNKYEYKIYSPVKIISSEIDTFFENKIDIKTKPLLVDSKSFQKIENIENFQIPKENQNIQISVKESVLNPTKYYIKLSNLDTSKPFLLQMNQTFGMSWKIKWVDKSYFDEKNCIDEYKNYSITQNSICQYKTKLLELEDIRLLNKPEVNNKNHFEGNFVGNTWLVNPEDIPNEMKGEKELYAVIIYEKQIYYSYSLVISGLIFLTLILLTIIQESREIIRSKRDKIMK
ncbi:MAG: hypothetical protein AB7E37_03220 [Candidatus Altimarinota bacterium]